MIQRLLPTAALLLALSPFTVAAQPPPAPPGAAPAPPAAGPGSEADKRFRRGIELYNEGDFRAALIEFRRAYELDPRYQALYNIGETYFQLQDYAQALTTLERYLRDGGAKVPPERRDEVLKEIDKLRVRVASIEITTRTPGLEITIDDLPAGKTPLTTMVSAGRRKITVTRPGKPPVTQVIELAGGDSKKIALDIHDDTPGEEAKPKSVPAAPWVVTGVLAVGAIVTGSLALSASGSLKDELAKRPGDKDVIDSTKTRTFALALTTDILVGSALVMAGVSIYFTASALSTPQKPDQPQVARVRWIGAPGAPGAAEGRGLVLTAGPRNVSLSGSF